MGEQKWKIYLFKIFYQQYLLLALEVKALKEKSPEEYKKNPKTKLLKSLRDAIRVDVPSDPQHPKFNLGVTLGPEYKQFKRVKNGLPRRYRLFFQFSSQEETIIFIWMNDAYSIRSQGSKRDVYNVFKKMIKNGTIPEKYSELFESSKVCNFLNN